MSNSPVYDESSIILPDNYAFFPENAPRSVNSTWGELRNMYDGVPSEGPVSDEMALKLIQNQSIGI